MKTIKDVEVFLLECVNTIGLGFHPDNDFSDYVDALNADVFSDEQSKLMNSKMSDAFDLCDANDVDIYEIVYNIFTK